MDFDKLLQSLAELGTTWGVRIIGVLIALIISFWIARRVHNSIERSLSKRNFDATLTTFFASMARYGNIIGAVLGCLGVFGIQTASFAAVIAAAGLAIGLAFQGTLSNFAGGVMLLVFRPFKVGDLVKVAGELGFVEKIELFSTLLRTPDNRCIIVPSKAIFGSTIENLTFHPTRRVDISIGAEYSADVDKTRAALEGCVKDIPNILEDPAPQIFLEKLGASSVDWQVRVWSNTADYWTVHQSAIRAAKLALDEAGIGIPFPQLDVHFDKMP
ncbi:MAG: mechanosensitive ion channel domain-containing protein [bacterium]